MLDPFRDFSGLDRCDTIDEAITKLNETDGPVRVALAPPIDDDSEEYADEVFGELINYGRNLLLGLDESTLWSGPAGSKRLRKLVLQGRRFGIRIVAACQQIQLVPWVVMSQLTQLVVFNTTRPQDTEVLRQWVGREVAEGAKHLPIGYAYLVQL